MTQQVSNKGTNSDRNISNLRSQPNNFLRENPDSGILTGSKGVIIGVALGIFIALLGGRLLSNDPPSENTATSPVATPTVKPIAGSVTTTVVNNSAIPRSLKATGTVAAVEMIPVFTRSTGLQVSGIIAYEGDFVNAGQVLARLDDRTLRAELASAEAQVAEASARLQELQAGARPEEIARAREDVNFAEADVARASSQLDLARRRVQRNQSLEVEGAITRDRLDEVLNEERIKSADLRKAQASLREARQRLAELLAGERTEVIAGARANVARARASVQLAREQLNNTTIVAPVSGKIATRNAKVGDIASNSAQTPLFEIIQNGRLELQVKVPETELYSIAPGQSVRVTTDSNSNLNLVGTVREIDPVVDAESRLATVKVDLPDSSYLRPGMFLKAAILTDNSSGLSVPVAAVIPQDGGEGIVYLLQNGDIVKEVKVKMGEILPDDRVEIVSGLKPGDRVVVKGAGYLKDGDRVKVTESRE